MNSSDDVRRTQLRFLTKFKRHGGGCWTWNGSVRSDGYGMFWSFGKNVAAHRYAYEMFHGPIPDGMHVCHRCDVPLCVKPSHLFLGTGADNHADKAAKGRSGKGIRRREHYEVGERNPVAKLRSSDVLAIREARERGESLPALAARFGVSTSHVARIVKREVWVHI